MFKLSVEGPLIKDAEIKEFPSRKGGEPFKVLEFTLSARQRDAKRVEGEFAASRLVRVSIKDKFQIERLSSKLVKGARVMVDGDANIREYTNSVGKSGLSVEITTVKDLLITKYADSDPVFTPPQEPAVHGALAAAADADVPF